MSAGVFDDYVNQLSELEEKIAWSLKEFDPLNLMSRAEVKLADHIAFLALTCRHAGKKLSGSDRAKLREYEQAILALKSRTELEQLIGLEEVRSSVGKTKWAESLATPFVIVETKPSPAPAPPSDEETTIPIKTLSDVLKELVQVQTDGNDMDVKLGNVDAGDSGDGSS